MLIRESEVQEKGGPRRPATNRLLSGLPPEELEILRPHLDPAPLTAGQQLYGAARPVEFAWFPQSGVVSVTKKMQDGSAVEIATVGPEGMVGLPIVLGEQEEIAARIFVQVPGPAARITADALRRCLERCPTLHRFLLRYTLALLNQVAQNAACNSVHSVEKRCARWLLMTHDRVHQNAVSPYPGVSRANARRAATDSLDCLRDAHESRADQLLARCDRRGGSVRIRGGLLRMLPHHNSPL